ncbi:MAG: hypothetical protein BroJett042_18990 [Bacteroidota bacterium]|nr:MAG: hypothetical protein UZ12_BCD005000796 [Bacteroidetes bacterium OLB12]GIL23386.1 MAG: hypothetical protein BroJett042_18990 [Bacteroidota bacterium]HNR75305.1 DUF5606 domain-containing protein [Cyclobacteriaceae bacterium]HNU42610.1 DUF5606 domain-containing protein [Cyclobacteriaceae bacterium]
MELNEIASISGKGGLFKVLKPGKSGVLLESLDATKTRLVANATHRLSLLSEISIYTTTKEGTVPLEDVLKKIHQEYKNDLGINADSDGSELRAFLKSVLPEFDENRVYVSDIKKLVKWYGILVEQAPEVFTQQKKED